MLHKIPADILQVRIPEFLTLGDGKECDRALCLWDCLPSGLLHSTRGPTFWLTNSSASFILVRCDRQLVPKKKVATEPVQSRLPTNAMINGRRGITPSTALRLAKFFGMSADFWMNLQLRWDLYSVEQDEQDILNRIRQHQSAEC
ncbi:MAG: HigA family addiction module antitoxin [Synechococcales bacterium]|nr:HigA family addiction module antitoxin [Synechococcales bacterium]